MKKIIGLIIALSTVTAMAQVVDNGFVITDDADSSIAIAQITGPIDSSSKIYDNVFYSVEYLNGYTYRVIGNPDLRRQFDEKQIRDIRPIKINK